MKSQILSLIAVLLIANSVYGAAEDRLEFKLTVSPARWESPKDDKTKTPILILWCVKNKTDQGIILPVGTPSRIELISTNNTNLNVATNSSGTSKIIITKSDYYGIAPGFSMYTLGKLELSLTVVNKLVYLDAGDMSGGGVHIGPLAPGKYKIRCTYSTNLDPSEFANQLIKDKANVWLGEYTSEWIDITIE